MKMFVILSHHLTDAQKQEIEQRFNIHDIIYLPEYLKKQWMNIPAKGSWQDDWISGIKNWLTNQMSDQDKVIVQGEFGATISMVSWLKSKGHSVYYATSERKVKEEVNVDGSIETRRIFQHVQFREYP